MPEHISPEYVVGLTSDGADASGRTMFGDIGLERLTDAGISWRLLPELDPHRAPDASSLEGVDAVLSFGHVPFDAGTARRAPRLKHVARFGAGYDGIDPVGLAAEGVVVTTTPDAVRGPLALSAVTLVLACAHRLVENHRATAAGRFSKERGKHRGQGVQGRTAGVVGFGAVGRLVAGHLQNLGYSVLTLDRPSAREPAAAMDVGTCSLLELAERSDVVVVTASLNPSSRGLISADFLAAMRPSAYLVNVARGGLVDERALVDALREGRIAGAGLDVFDPEPPAAENPLLQLDNVTLSPHALCWTEDFTRDVSASVIRSIIEVAQGMVPEAALSRDQVDTASWRGRRR
ncbi:2-hydroxyacid dehydrogenase [Brachybacterium squillarum]|uniref:2-hydroxyacid dehydrogenase n=1 Tax=Brachybacterium squillarum TaxID=661979 RepID=UPI0022221B3D|nr:NAD(P)-dependent oxidoreductase [Brachybacterium squillarum]MCW1805116.1 hypothetical protein [Brachybacterium squillarum]